MKLRGSSACANSLVDLSININRLIFANWFHKIIKITLVVHYVPSPNSSSFVVIEVTQFIYYLKKVFLLLKAHFMPKKRSQPIVLCMYTAVIRPLFTELYKGKLLSCLYITGAIKSKPQATLVLILYIPPLDKSRANWNITKLVMVQSLKRF